MGLNGFSFSVPTFNRLVLIFSTSMIFSAYTVFIFTTLIQGAFSSPIPGSPTGPAPQAPFKGITHYPPSLVPSNDLSKVFDPASGTNNGFYSPKTPAGSEGAYNYCNMPRVSAQTYPNPVSAGYKLEYVELVHRHHKRSPYQSNTFPKEDTVWYCDQAPLFSYANNESAHIKWNVYRDSAALNPFQTGPNGTCQFPQITAGGLRDSSDHGKDLRSVYGDLLGFLPDEYDPNLMQFRVTNNVITSQVAGGLIDGFFDLKGQGPDFGVFIQPAAFDSLEPAYTCNGANTIRNNYQTTPEWFQHINDTRTQDLFKRLDALSKVDPKDSGWHVWMDHYFDNLSSRLCHDKPLPCEVGNPNNCISQEDAQLVFRLADYEYNFIYRQAQNSTAYSVGKYGLFLNELVHHLEAKVTGNDSIVYRHNVAHDGSISALLGALQIEFLRWPGLGSEVVFELWTKKNDNGHYLRVLYGGAVLRSSALGPLDMIKLEDFTAYIKGLIGDNVQNVIDICTAK